MLEPGGERPEPTRVARREIEEELARGIALRMTEMAGLGHAFVPGADLGDGRS